MKTIYELWDEIKKHPDYVTGSLWTVEDVASEYLYAIEIYLEDKIDYEEIDEEEIKKYSLERVKQNVELFKDAIENFEGMSHREYSIDYGSWEQFFLDDINIKIFKKQ